MAVKLGERTATMSSTTPDLQWPHQKKGRASRMHGHIRGRWLTDLTHRAQISGALNGASYPVGFEPEASQHAEACCLSYLLRPAIRDDAHPAEHMLRSFAPPGRAVARANSLGVKLRADARFQDLEIRTPATNARTHQVGLDLEMYKERVVASGMRLATLLTPLSPALCFARCDGHCSQSQFGVQRCTFW